MSGRSAAIAWAAHAVARVFARPLARSLGLALPISVALLSSCLRGASSEPQLLLFRYGLSEYPENRMRENGSERRLPFAWDFYMLKTGSGLYLIDTGFSDRRMPGYKTMFALTDYAEPVDLLAQAGFAPDDITGIILTHAHFDHAGSLTEFVGTKAVVYLREKEWRAVQYESDRQASSADFPSSQDSDVTEARSHEASIETYKRNQSSYSIYSILQSMLATKQLRLIGSEPFQILGGLMLEESGGHTVGSQMLIYSDSTRQWRFSGDECYTTAYCKDGVYLPDAVRASRQRNEEAVQRMQAELRNTRLEDARIFTMHDRLHPNVGVGVHDCSKACE